MLAIPLSFLTLFDEWLCKNDQYFLVRYALESFYSYGSGRVSDWYIWKCQQGNLCVCVGGEYQRPEEELLPLPSCGYTKLWLKNNLQVGGYYIFKHDRKRILIFKYMMKEKSKEKNRKIFFLTQRTSFFFCLNLLLYAIPLQIFA